MKSYQVNFSEPITLKQAQLLAGVFFDDTAGAVGDASDYPSTEPWFIEANTPGEIRAALDEIGILSYSISEY